VANRVSRSVIATTSWAIGRRAALYSSSGLRDSYGVPIGNYYFAVASVRDRIAAAPDVDWKPDTWMAWQCHAGTARRAPTSVRLRSSGGVADCVL
jgi:hypothetical protein